MTTRIKVSLVFSSLLLTIMLIVGAVLGKSEESRSAYAPLSVYTEVLARIKSDYVEEPDIPKVTRGALQGLVEYIDPLSSYLSKEQFEEWQQAKSNPDKGTGLSTGIVVHKRGAYVAILSVLPGSPADKAGLRPFDLIEAIDGMASRMMSPALLQARLSGKPGTKVRLVVRALQDYEEPKELVLERGDVKLPDVTFKMLEDGIGYIDADVLTTEHVNQIRGAVEDLEKKGAGKFILDLRTNALGDPQEGVRLANLFLGEGSLGSLKGQKYEEKKFTAGPDSAVTDAELVVLCDRPTSGGAEMAAAILLDRKRAEVVGERTYGLAAVQQTLPLDDGAALILSTAKYYRPSGAAVQDDGVEPSESLTPAELRRYRRGAGFPGEVPPPDEPGVEVTEGEDPFLKKALQLLKEGKSA